MTELRQCLEVLKELEWIYMPGQPYKECPYCGLGEQHGHQDDCKLAEVLGRKKNASYHR